MSWTKYSSSSIILVYISILVYIYIYIYILYIYIYIVLVDLLKFSQTMLNMEDYLCDLTVLNKFVDFYPLII